MDNITIIDGDTLTRLLSDLDQRNSPGARIHTLRIHQREDGFAYKINSGCWSPTVGRRADEGGY